jgi:hypothetical protein
MSTAALYSYTPHIHGNRLLWSVWNRWFGAGAADIIFPDGSILRNERTKEVSLFQNGKLRPVRKPSVLASRFASRPILDLNDFDYRTLVEMFPGRPVRFAENAIVRTEDGAVYLLARETRRRVVSTEVAAAVGINPEEIEDAVFEDIADLAEGMPITSASSARPGRLVQDAATGGVYYAEGDVKRPIPDRAVLAANFAGWPIAPRSRDELDALVTGEPVRFPDGALIKAPHDPTVFVISRGGRRPIADEETFLLLGYKWRDILVASPRSLALHPVGEALGLQQ